MPAYDGFVPYSIMSQFVWFDGNLQLIMIYERVITKWDKLEASEKTYWYNYFLDLVKDSQAFEFLDDDELDKLHAYWPNLANVIFTLINADYKYNPEDYHYSDAWAGGTDGTNTFQLELYCWRKDSAGIRKCV